VSTSQQVFSAWLRSDIAPRLRDAGFSGSGQDFHRRIGRNWAVVNFQRDRYSTAQELRFTVNLGTASAAALAASGEDPDAPPPEVICHWRQRIGALLPLHHDVWWTIRDSADQSDLHALTQEVGDALTERAMPELERMANDQAILLSSSSDRAFLELSPAEQDVVGPILRESGTEEEFRSYLATLDARHPPLDMYEIWDSYAPRIGPARTAKALAKLKEARRFEPRGEALRQLAVAQPSPEVLVAVRTQLNDENAHVQFAAASAAGRLGDVDAVGRLIELVAGGKRFVACAAALALGRLVPRLDDAGRRGALETLRLRHGVAVGHERPLLRHVIGQLEQLGDS
jgi:hypothetical protein